MNDVTPVYKCFIVNDKFYCYDTFTNRILSISQQHFYELEILQRVGVQEYIKNHSNSEVAKDIVSLLDKGFLNCNYIETVSHPDTLYVEDACLRGIYDMTLQVTRDCNFKCRYCSFAREHNIDRTHENLNMTWAVAKGSIDFLFEHSKDSEEVYLSFYGGEPLLNFSLIKQAVEYIEGLFSTKKVVFNMTTNGSVLSDKILDFLMMHEFRLLISFDGPKSFQNNHRRFYANGNDTFDVVMTNVRRIMNHSEYFKDFVRFSSVLLKDEPCDDILSFFKRLGIERNQIEYTYANINGIDYVESPFLTLAKDKKTKSSNKYDIYLDDIVTKNFIEHMENRISEHTYFPKKWHHSGPCIPSVTKIFVNVYGDFFPCEKIIESPISKIGSLKEGLDLDRITQQMNIGKISEKRCKQCWAARFCEICVMRCIDLEKNAFSDSLKENVCKFQEKNIEDYLKYYVSKKQL